MLIANKLIIILKSQKYQSKDEHDSSTQSNAGWDCDYPSQSNISKETPVDTLLFLYLVTLTLLALVHLVGIAFRPTDQNHWAYFAMGGWDRDADLAGQQNC